MFRNLPASLRYNELPQGYNPLNPWEYDLTAPKRKRIADTLCNYLKKCEIRQGVISVNAGWGMGKSLFLRMWQDDLLNQGVACLYFNAWENDFAEEPVFSFLTTLERQARDIKEKFDEATGKTEQSDSKQTPREQFLERLCTARSKVKDMAKKAVRLSLPAFKKVTPAVASAAMTWAATEYGTVNHMVPPIAVMAGKAVEGVQDACSTSFDSQPNAVDAEKTAQSIIASFSDRADQMREFKKLLSEYAAILTTDQDLPLFILVDELDRCRPNFAITLLEEIKHLFSVPGIVFVLATEKEQLANCISATYGLSKCGALVYLDKFIDMNIELPIPDVEKFLNNLNTFVRIPSHNFFKHALLSFIKESGTDISMRGIAQVMIKLGFVSAQSPNTMEQLTIAALLIFMQNGRTLEESFELISSLGKKYENIIEDTEKMTYRNIGNVILALCAKRLAGLPFPSNLEKPFHLSLDMQHLVQSFSWGGGDCGKRWANELQQFLGIAYPISL